MNNVCIVIAVCYDNDLLDPVYLTEIVKVFSNRISAERWIDSEEAKMFIDSDKYLSRYFDRYEIEEHEVES